MKQIVAKIHPADAHYYNRHSLEGKEITNLKTYPLAEDVAEKYNISKEFSRVTGFIDGQDFHFLAVIVKVSKTRRTKNETSKG